MRFLVKLEALSLLFYPFPGGHKLSLPNDYILCVVYLAPTSLAGFVAILSIAGFLRTKVVACRFLCVDRRLRPVDMDDVNQGPRRSNVSPVSCAALMLLSGLPSHEPLDDWYFTHPETSVLADEQDEQAEQNEKEFEQEFEEFDEGDDLEPDLTLRWPS